MNKLKSWASGDWTNRGSNVHLFKLLVIVLVMGFLVPLISMAGTGDKNENSIEEEKPFKRLEIRLSYGTWHLGPITPLLESKTNEVLDSFVDYVHALGYSLNVNDTQTSIKESFQPMASFSLWYRLNRDFSFGVKVSRFNISMPYTFNSFLNVTVPGTSIHIEATADGDGYLDIDSWLINALARYRLWSNKRWEVAIVGGLNLLPIKGEFHYKRHAIIKRAGYQDYIWNDQDTSSIDEMKNKPDLYPYVPPKLLVSPTVGGELRYWMSDGFSAQLEVFFAEGFNLSVGVGIHL